MIKMLKSIAPGFLIAACVGGLGLMISNLSNLPIFDPLVIAMGLGIAIKAFVLLPEKALTGIKRAPLICIPPGVAIYGAVSLNFHAASVVKERDFLIILLVVFLVYIISALLLSSLFGLKEKVGYLVAAGSCICGASAITITSQAIDAEPEDISVSLIAVFLSALIGLFIILPLTAAFFKISGLDYAAFSGSVLQFSGFVKASVADLPQAVKDLALSIKALRYLGLLFIIPLFSSFIKGKLYTPWYLWAFLLSGILFSLMPSLAAAAIPVLKPVLNILWGIAMAAIGLNADIKKIGTINGAKTFIVSLLAFLIAVFTFILMNKGLFSAADRLF
ncbi:MAG: YeiH family protein [Candidatus Omnitrophica bacterium]|nr:YeiH family protein [Candidatus Omnitrophota bacterium]